MAGSKKLKILIVDDDKFLLDMYALKFANSDFEADTANGSPDALKKLRGGADPDVLILDIIMPHMDGLELLSIVRKENLAPRATVIMLTNQSQPADIEKAKELKADGYIVKASTIPSEVVKEALRIYESSKSK